MQNVRVERKGDILCLFVNIGKSAQDSAPVSKTTTLPNGQTKGGKSRVLATTRGFQQIEGVGVSLNCILPLG